MIDPAACASSDGAVSKSQRKKEEKLAKIQAQKQAKQAAREQAACARDQEPVVETTYVNEIALDTSLPEPSMIRIKDTLKCVGERVQVRGWVHTRRNQGAMIFLFLRDGSGLPATLQVVMIGDLAKTRSAQNELTREATVHVYGTILADERAPGGVELRVDYWKLIGTSDVDLENRFNKDSNG
jgi:asparaginyl-tRNA synthetase